MNSDGSTACGINPVFTAVVTGSDGTTPPSCNAGVVWSVTGGATLRTGAGGNGENFAEYHFYSAGTYTVTATFTAAYCPIGVIGPYTGVVGSASYQVVATP